MSSDDAASTIASAFTVTVIIAGASVVISTIVLVAVLGMMRERKLRQDVEQQAERVQYLKGIMAANSHHANTFQTLEDLMKPYKKHLLQSAFDLQSRLTGQLSSAFLYDFNKRGDRDRAYAIDSTTYFFAEFFGWLEVIRRQVVFITGSEYAESLNSLLDSIRFQLTGETPIQGCTKNCKRNNDCFDEHSGILQLYIVDIRSMGNAMLHKVDNLLRPITVDTFLQHMNSDEPRHKAFKQIMAPLRSSLTRLSELDMKSAPIRRIAIFQVLLCKLIDILDNSVPWDCGPKFDSSEEPRYIQRDMRMTPGVRFLSNLQKSHLQGMPFFDDDPNLSFPGFREDMKNQPQEFRDEKLWPGACPPQEPRQRDVEYKMPDQYAHIGARAVVTWPIGLRRRPPKKHDSANSNTKTGPSQVQPSLSQLRRMARDNNASEQNMQRPTELAAAGSRLARRSSYARGESLPPRPPASSLSAGSSMAQAQSLASSQPAELAVTVHPPPLPGTVPEAAAGSGARTSSSGQQQQQQATGSRSEEVLARAVLPLSPGRSRGLEDLPPPESHHISVQQSQAGQTT